MLVTLALRSTIVLGGVHSPGLSTRCRPVSISENEGSCRVTLPSEANGSFGRSHIAGHTRAHSPRLAKGRDQLFRSLTPQGSTGLRRCLETTSPMGAFLTSEDLARRVESATGFFIQMR